MKKVISLILVLVMCAAIFAGCGNSGSNAAAGGNGVANNGTSNNGTSNNGASNSDTTNTGIVGTWEGDEAGETVTYTFKADGTFVADYVSGTYTISGDKITLTSNVNGQEIKIFDNATFSIEGNTLKMGECTYTKK